jgi:hypothetical protein
MKERDRSHLVARQLQGAAALALGSGLRRKRLEDIAQHKERHVLVGRGHILERPFTAIEAIKGPQKPFGGIRGGV